MQLRPILSAMNRNKFGAILIATQMAVTLAFLSNSLTIIESRLSWSARPTGVDEANLFVISSEMMEGRDDLTAHENADVAALRSLNGVVDAYATNDYPLAGGGWSSVGRIDRGPKDAVGNPNTISAAPRACPRQCLIEIERRAQLQRR